MAHDITAVLNNVATDLNYARDVDGDSKDVADVAVDDVADVAADDAGDEFYETR